MGKLTKEQTKLYKALPRRVIGGIDVFYCKPHKCWLSEAGCIKYQEHIVEPDYGNNVSYVAKKYAAKCCLCETSKVLQTKYNITIEFPDLDDSIVVCSKCGKQVPRTDIPQTEFNRLTGRRCKECVRKVSTEYYTNKLTREAHNTPCT